MSSESLKKHTKDILADELLKIGLLDMSLKARSGYYHDYLSPLDAPCMQLAIDLAAIKSPDAENLLKRHMDGEFDASIEESDEWAASPDGQAAFAMLRGDRKGN